MNIHLQDKDVFNNILNSTFFNVRMGSYLYELQDDKSDTDFLCVYAPSLNQVNSFNRSIHQVQYKYLELQVDYVFTDLYSFFWNLLNGDSTISFEILHTDDYKKSEFGRKFEFLTEEMRTYSIIVSYLGFASRDIKYFWKEKTERDKIKKLLHIMRGLNFAKQIFYDYKNFSLIDNSLAEKKNTLQTLQSKNLDDVCKSYLESLSEEIKSFRHDILNVALDKKEIVRFLPVELQKKLDDTLSHFAQSPTFLNKQQKFISLEHYYSVNENELKY